MNGEPTRRNRRRTASLCVPGAALGTSLLVTGCSHSPEYSIFGSFFPAWIFCSLGGLLFAAGTRAVVARSAIAEYVIAPVLLYLSIAVFLGCVLWLLLYS